MHYYNSSDGSAGAAWADILNLMQLLIFKWCRGHEQDQFHNQQRRKAQHVSQTSLLLLSFLYRWLYVTVSICRIEPMKKITALLTWQELNWQAEGCTDFEALSWTCGLNVIISNSKTLQTTDQTTQGSLVKTELNQVWFVYKVQQVLTLSELMKCSLSQN